ncbi:MAG: hypothetical protein IPN34_10870 [Planctomycetes bacterium]|nr:hypothetical protein [Planctomycetota bacterium]
MSTASLVVLAASSGAFGAVAWQVFSHPANSEPGVPRKLGTMAVRRPSEHELLGHCAASGASAPPKMARRRAGMVRMIESPVREGPKFALSCARRR